MMKDLTWMCHVCGEERPDAFISVHFKKGRLGGGISFIQNIRYCSDKLSCVDGAKDVTFTKHDPSP